MLILRVKMFDLREEQKEPGTETFNAVIEGVYQNKGQELHYKIIQLQVPEGTLVLNDGVYRYKLYGKTEDFRRIQSCEVKGLEATIGSLGSYPGIILLYKGGITGVLNRPRGVFMRDGRIFIEDSTREDKGYIEKLHKKIISGVGGIFENEEYSKWFNRYSSFIGS